MVSESNSYLEGDRKMKSEGLYTFRIVPGPFGHMPKRNSTVSFPQQLALYLQDTLHNNNEKHKTHEYIRKTHSYLNLLKSYLNTYFSRFKKEFLSRVLLI